MENAYVNFFNFYLEIFPFFSSDGSNAQVFELPPPGQGQEEAIQALDNQRTSYFAEVTDQLNPKIPTKFWA